MKVIDQQSDKNKGVLSDTDQNDSAENQETQSAFLSQLLEAKQKLCSCAEGAMKREKAFSKASENQGKTADVLRSQKISRSLAQYEMRKDKEFLKEAENNGQTPSLFLYQLVKAKSNLKETDFDEDKIAAKSAQAIRTGYAQKFGRNILGL